MSDPSAADNSASPAEQPAPVPASAENPSVPASGSEPRATEQPAGAGPEAEPVPEAKSESLVDALADLLQMAVNYLRQEAAGVMRDKVVLPGQMLGRLVAFALAAAFLLALGLGFIAVALLLLLAQWLTWPGALGAIGGVLVIGAAVFTYLKVRSIQK